MNHKREKTCGICLYESGFMNRVNMKNTEQVSMEQVVEFLEHIPRSGITGSYSRCIFIF